MTDHKVERALGYTPCVCGVINGTWHDECYRGKTTAQLATGYKSAFDKARVHLKNKHAQEAARAIARAAEESRP